MLQYAVANKESWGGFQSDSIYITVAYPGASPREVEEGVVVKIEEAIETIRGINELTSTASDGSAQVQIKLENGYEENEVLDEVKLAVDAIATFPAEIERPVFSRSLWRRGAIDVQLHGDLDEATMKNLGADPYGNHRPARGLLCRSKRRTPVRNRDRSIGTHDASV